MNDINIGIFEPKHLKVGSNKLTNVFTIKVFLDLFFQNINRKANFKNNQ